MPTRVCLLLALLSAASLAGAQSADKRAEMALMVEVRMDACIRVDQTLRSICTRHQAHLPESFKSRCAVPTLTFKERTAVDYGKFRRSYASELDQQQALISKAQEKVARAFDQQFANVLAGRLNDMDLDALSSELTRNCAVIEKNWLQAPPSSPP